eukprot:XP_011430922.1 PREDICTED: zinc finger CCCH domain-containing protein 13-like [Crassostrea gigas]
MSKIKRRVTVDSAKSVPDEGDRRKPSVFERLGPGARKQLDDRGESSYNTKCRRWLISGECNFGNSCKFQHGPPYKKARGEDSPDKSRARPKHFKKEIEASDSDSDQRSRSKVKKEKIRSIVSKKAAVPDSDSDSSGDSWEQERPPSDRPDLDFKKELELERQRQLIQKELSQLSQEEEARENITIQKKVSPTMPAG